MSFPQLGYQYIRPIYPPERQGIASTRAGTELSPTGALSNVLSTMYGPPFAAAQGYGAFLPYSNDLSIFSQLGAQYELKDSPGVQHPGFAHHHPAFYPYGQYQFGDPSRPKNATRESTSTLKAWLSEHRKNPYPTKGEKIMLAIITKMTLTQVSTWFANARRRLKKENKMTWAPRSRTDEDGNVYSSDHEEEVKRDDDEEIDLENIDTENIENKDDLDDQDDMPADLKLDARSDSEISDGYEDLQGSEQRFLKAVVKESKDMNGVRNEHLHQHSLEIKATQPNGEQLKLNAVSINSPPSDNNAAPTQKPKIWSLAETATTPDSPKKVSTNEWKRSWECDANANRFSQTYLLSCWETSELDKQRFFSSPARFIKFKPLPRTGQPGFDEQPCNVRPTDRREEPQYRVPVTERSSALEAEKKLLKTAFHPVQRRPQNQLEAAMVLSALSSS